MIGESMSTEAQKHKSTRAHLMDSYIKAILLLQVFKSNSRVQILKIFRFYSCVDILITINKNGS